MSTLKESYADIDAVFTDLGPPLAAFEPALNSIANWLFIYGTGFLAGLAGLGWGLYLLIAHDFQLPLVGAPKNELDWAKAAILLMGSLCPVLLCSAMFVIKYQQMSDRILVYPDGFINARARKIEVFRWDDVEKVLQDYVEPEEGENGSSTGSGPRVTSSTTFLVKRKDGGEFGFEQGSLENHMRFARLLYAEAKKRDIAWEIYVPK